MVRPKRHNDAAAPRLLAHTALCLAMLLGGELLFALDWPSQDAKMQSNFGQSEQGRPMVAAVFASEGTVRAADSGETLFVHDSGDETGGFASPLGSWIAVDHGDGLVSVYGRMQPLDTEIAKTLVEKDSVLGRSGDSGWSKESGFYFSLLDRKEHRWVDPAMIAASRGDTQAPVIRSAWLVSGEGNRIPLARTRTVRQGSYRIVVEATDSENRSPSASLTPQRVICLVNGTEQGSLHLETIAAENGRLMVNRREATPAEEVYRSAPGVDLGEARFLRGKAVVEIIVRDAAGNERIGTYHLSVE